MGCFADLVRVSCLGFFSTWQHLDDIIISIVITTTAAFVVVVIIIVVTHSLLQG